MRFIGLIAAWLTLEAAAAPRDRGYLLQVGPVPLRFQSFHASPPSPLPPLPAPETQAVATVESTPLRTTLGPSEPAGGSSKTGSQEPAASKPRSAVPDGPTPPAASVTETNLAPVITPQMLMQFIINHAAAARESAPLETPVFQPPSVPSSSATYISEPAR